MSDKERLEDIKNFVKTINGDFTAQLFGYDIKPESIVNDFKWLINRVEELEEGVKEAVSDIENISPHEAKKTLMDLIKNMEGEK